MELETEQYMTIERAEGVRDKARTLGLSNGIENQPQVDVVSLTDYEQM